VQSGTEKEKKGQRNEEEIDSKQHDRLVKGVGRNGERKAGGEGLGERSEVNGRRVERKCLNIVTLITLGNENCLAACLVLCIVS